MTINTLVKTIKGSTYVIAFFFLFLTELTNIRAMHYSQADVDIPLKITFEPEFLLEYPFSLMLLMDFLKYVYNYHFINYEIRLE